MTSTKPIFYSKPASLRLANKAAPYLASILKSGKKNYDDMTLLQNTINKMVQRPSNDAGYLKNLELLISQFYTKLENLNSNIDEVHELYGDYTSVSKGIISFLGKRRETAVFLSMEVGDTEFTSWRYINCPLSKSQPIVDKNEFM